MDEVGKALAFGAERVRVLEVKFPLQMEEGVPQGAGTVLELAWPWGDGIGHILVEKGVLEVDWLGAAKNVVDC